ncbi:MAG: gluconeogenesis factor YvcK family protein [Pyrinomonadaceae bacterium]
MAHNSQDGSKDGINIVCIGGGTGLSTLLAGLKEKVRTRIEGATLYATDDATGDGTDDRLSGAWLNSLSAIVTVTDDGGSSGRLREELQILPPGDIRNCMVALSEDSTLLSRLFRHRFSGAGSLGGHSFGNLFLAALTEVTGDFVEAVRLSSEVLASKGRIYPSTLSDVQLVAELSDGTIVEGETRITGSRCPIKRLRLEPEQCLPLPETLTAIGAADIITIGPGSLYTSLLPNLLVKSVAQAIATSPATTIYISNLMTQPGETDGFDVESHLRTLKSYAPEIEFDHVVINDRPISSDQSFRYAADGAYQIGVREGQMEESLSNLQGAVFADLLDDGEMVRHSPDKLARVILDCLAQSRTRRHL